MKRLTAFALAVLATSSCVTTVTMDALEPKPGSTIVRRPSAKTFGFKAGVSENPVCMIPTGGYRYCFVDFRRTFELATVTALSGLLTPSAPSTEPDFLAEVKTLSVYEDSARGYSHFAIEWAFELTDRSGRVIVHINGDQRGGSIDYDPADPTVKVKAIEGAILDKIVAAVAQSVVTQDLN